MIKRCIDCGSTEIAIHGLSHHPKKICCKCLGARKKKRTAYNRKHEQKAVCIRCGRVSKQRKQIMKRVGGDGIWKCKQCEMVEKYRGGIFSKCKNCGKEIKNKRIYKKRELCDPCLLRERYSHLKIKSGNGFCFDCGRKLTKKNKTHCSTGYTCNECMYIRKRRYKDRVKYGGGNIKIMDRIRLIEASSKSFKQQTSKEGELKKCKKENLEWSRVVNQRKRLLGLKR